MAENIGVRLKELREKAGLTQAELAEKLDVTQAAMSQYENGTRKPSDSTKVKIADFFNISVQSIFFDP